MDKAFIEEACEKYLTAPFPYRVKARINQTFHAAPRLLNPPSFCALGLSEGFFPKSLLDANLHEHGERVVHLAI